MIEVKVSDYITVSLLPGEIDGLTPMDLARKMLEAWMLEDSFDLFQPVSQNWMYEFILRFGDISLKLPYQHNMKKQGVCLEFSGSGVSYYREYLATHRVNADLRLACRRFIGLAKLGFKSKCSRFDVAFDEKHTKNDNEDVFLDLDVIKATLFSRLFVSKFRKGDPMHQSLTLKPSVFAVDEKSVDEDLYCNFIVSQNFSSGRIGKTIELGKRKSNTFVRFYDKLAEQEAHNFSVPEDLISWIRFEIEFKNTRANSIMAAYAIFDKDEDFINYVRGVALGIIRFVDPDHSRRYNCTTCAWWYEFLNRAHVARLVYNKPKYNRYVRALESKKRQQAASFAALITCNRKNLKSIILSGFKKDSKTARAIIADFEAIQALSPEEYDEVYKESTRAETGLEFWKHFAFCSSASDEEFEKFLDNCLDLLCKDVEKILDGHLDCVAV